MEHFGIGNDLVVNWRLIYSDGTPFPMTGEIYELFYCTGRGMSVAQDTMIIGEDSNVLAWTFKAEDQVFTGRYDLILRLYSNDVRVAEIKKRGAFYLSATVAGGNGASSVTVESICDAASIPDAVLRADKAADRATAASAIAEELNEIFIEREPKTVTAEDPEAIGFAPTDDDSEYPDISL